MSNAVRRAVNPGRRSYLIFSFGLVAIVAGLIACNDTPQNSVAPVAVIAASTKGGGGATNHNAFVGEGHNAMVDAVLRDVSKKWAKKGPHKKLCKQVEESAIEYARTTARNSAEAIRILKEQNFCGSPGSSSVRGASALANPGDGYALSGRAVELLNAMDYYVGVSYSAGQLDSYLGPINAAANAELDWEEAEIVTSASSVAVSSFGYWSTNLDTWRYELQPGLGSYLRSNTSLNDVGMTPQYSFWGEVWGVARADLEGAISGGVAARIAKAAIPEYAMWSAGGKSLIHLINMI